MPARERKVVVFVHGWSVTHTETYGGLPERLAAEARAAGLDVSVREIFLGKYVSFRDEVRLGDVARAFEAAVQREVAGLLAGGRRFACIAHSTGGPVIREWWRRHYTEEGRACPMSHLVMLAPANFGSALAQLGQSALSRVKTWFQGMEPGTGILDWLEPGSPESWELNLDWIRGGAGRLGPGGVFPFVLAGQTIDRTMYDHVVPLTAELGSDGVVRVASANLNAGYVRLVQEPPRAVRGKRDRYEAPRMAVDERADGPTVALRIIAGASHSGPKRGIQRSVHPAAGHSRGAETVAAILACLTVRDRRDYDALCERFASETDEIQRQERLETAGRVLLPDTHFIRDRHSMVIVRLQDDRDHVVEDADLLLTGGPDHDPNHLPRGFLAHVQRNRRHRGTLTYFFNHDVMVGSEPVAHGTVMLRKALPGAGMLGLKVRTRLDRALVHHLPCDLQASSELLRDFVRPNRTTLVDLVLRRVVREGVFRLDRGTAKRGFRSDPPGPPID